MGWPSGARTPPWVESMRNWGRVSSRGSQPMPAFCVSPKSSPLDPSSSISPVRGRLPRGPAPAVWTVQSSLEDSTMSSKPTRSGVLMGGSIRQVRSSGGPGRPHAYPLLALGRLAVRPRSRRRRDPLGHLRRSHGRRRPLERAAPDVPARGPDAAGAHAGSPGSPQAAPQGAAAEARPLRSGLDHGGHPEEARRHPADGAPGHRAARAARRGARQEDGASGPDAAESRRTHSRAPELRLHGARGQAEVRRAPEIPPAADGPAHGADAVAHGKPLARAAPADAGDDALALHAG